MDLLRFLLHLTGRLPAGVRHVLLLCLSAALTALTGALAAGKAPGEALFAAWLAILAVITPLVKSYGVTGRYDDQDK